MKGKSYYIGIDGFDFKYIEKFINEGLLPNLKEIINNGSSAVLNFTKPLLTPVAWILLFSVMKLELKKIFDWTYFKDNYYKELIPYLSLDVKVPREVLQNYTQKKKYFLYMMQLFDNKELREDFAEKLRKKAENMHNLAKNTLTEAEYYRNIIQQENES